MPEHTTLKIVCHGCGKDLGEKDGMGETGTTDGMCRECWPRYYPGPFPETDSLGDANKELEHKKEDV